MLSKEFKNEFNNNNKSGKMTKESYVTKNYKKDYDKIIDFTCDLDLPFKQKVYHTVNNINGYVYCKNPECENKVKYKNSKVGYYNHCSNKCIGLDPNIKKKKEKTNTKKYGEKHAALNKGVKEKVNEIYQSRDRKYYDKVNQKRINTVKNKYGVEHISQLEDFQERRKESFKDNIESWKESYKKTSIKKYGVEHPWMHTDIHKKSQVNGKKAKEKKLYEKVIFKIKDLNLYLIGINYETRNITLFCKDCNNNFSIHREYLHTRYKEENIICTNCNPISKHISGYEIDLLNYIKSIYDGDIITSDRRLLDGKEIDILLPEKKIAFEFNGLYWHSELNKDKRYHYNKTKMCKDLGVQLIHIWEDNWKLKKDIVKSIISNRLGKNINKLYARKCKIKEVSVKKARIFLNNNHIQGYSNSKYKIGLFYKEEIVSLMTFTKPRGINNDRDYELIRFCNKKGVSVIGGASRLFKNFLRDYNPNKVISYSDISIFNGNLYEKLGFLNKGTSPVNYKWVIGKKREHKSKYRKDNLIKMGYDPNKSEREIMYEDVGSFRIWDCGLIKWIYKN